MWSKRVKWIKKVQIEKMNHWVITLMLKWTHRSNLTAPLPAQ